MRAPSRAVAAVPRRIVAADSVWPQDDADLRARLVLDELTAILGLAVTRVRELQHREQGAAAVLRNGLHAPSRAR